MNELFRSVQHVIIRRAVLETVAQQDDPMKRARGNGGARTQLQPEGIVVLGHQDNDPLVAEALGLQRPQKGEFISARVVRVAASTPQPASRRDSWSALGPGKTGRQNRTSTFDSA